MIFWDTSAIVPLLVNEPTTPAVRAIFEREDPMVVWWGTSLECLSALARRHREGGLSTAALDLSRTRLDRLAEFWHEILPAGDLRAYAARLLLRHPLRAADALQLGAALHWARGQPEGHRFATLDARLGQAAYGEGFSLVFPQG